jgi:hypothetical protein
MSAQMGCGVGVEDFAGGIPGPQVRGTGGTLFCGLQSLQDRGHPPYQATLIMFAVHGG